MAPPPPKAVSPGESDGVEAATLCSDVPQLEQNLFVSRLDEPQFGHIFVMCFFPVDSIQAYGRDGTHPYDNNFGNEWAFIEVYDSARA